MKLIIKALIKVILGLVCMGILLFLPAGTFDYPNAWLLTAILFIPMIITGIIMVIKAPDLLKKRLNSKEENKDQKIIILLSTILFTAVFVVAGLDFRFGWSHISEWIVYAAAVIFLIGYVTYVEVMRENAYLSRTVEIQENQKVVDTGLYGIVRHPMYFATILLFLSMPLVLGSLYSFVLITISYPFIIAWRIKDEEKTLSEGLEGYEDYTKKVKYRMFPFIW